jgi:hypothetical protein
VLSAIFGAKAQVAVGAGALVLGAVFGVLGTSILEGAATWPWEWSAAAFIFHASMYFGLVACYAIVATGLGFRATERVETAVVENIERADTVDVG